MNWALVAPAIGLVVALSAVEGGALYSLQRYEKDQTKKGFLILGALIYGLAVPVLIIQSLKYEGVGSFNFLWNVVSTFIGFAIGIYFFGEKINNLQLIGIMMALVGLALVLLAKR